MEIFSPNGEMDVKQYIAIWSRRLTSGAGYAPRMGKSSKESLRAVVSRNLRALMKHARDSGNPDLSKPFGLEKRTGVSDDSITRYLNEERPIDVDALERLASAFGLHGAWELLVPSFDPAAPPAEQVRTLADLLWSRIKAEEEALDKLSGANGLVPRTTAPDGHGQGAHKDAPGARRA